MQRNITSSLNGRKHNGHSASLPARDSYRPRGVANTNEITAPSSSWRRMTSQRSKSDERAC